MQTGSSAFLFFFRESTPERYEGMSTDERRAALGTWNDWCDSLASRGHLQAGHPLLPEGRVISAGGQGRVTDGPFAEAKELVGGYFLVHAASLEEATALAEECPNLRHGLTVEVRPIATGCHLARSLGLAGMREQVEA